MFSVDNFYEIMSSRYNQPITDNMLTRLPDGEKQWTAMTLIPQRNLAYSYQDPKGYHLGKIVMHDQEPLLFCLIDDYRTSWREDKIAKGEDPTLINNISNGASRADLLHICFRSGLIPILCHSEKNSEVVSYLAQHNFIECYYWWHGMIAQDWYRHWRWHNDLAVRNKSTSQCRFLLYARGLTGTRTYRTKVVEVMRRYREITQYNWNDDQIDPTVSATVSVNDANTAHLHIVAETLFASQKLHLTEKILRPMVMSQAFVVFGPPGSLQYLRDYGFLTFGNIWDESYDTEDDHDKRMQMLFSLIEKLAKMSKEQFHRVCEKTLPIIAHNRSWFFGQQFQEKLCKELFDNFDLAIQTQKEQSKQFPAGTWFHTMNALCSVPGWPMSWKAHARDILKNLQLTHPEKYDQALKLYTGVLPAL